MILWCDYRATRHVGVDSSPEADEAATDAGSAAHALGSYNHRMRLQGQQNGHHDGGFEPGIGAGYGRQVATS